MEKRLLIVDDLSENRKLLASILKKNTDFDIVLAKSGVDVIKMFEREDCRYPDVILLDIMMPEMDGFEVAEKLKENSNTKDIPIIFITALTDTESKVRAFEMGGVDYISKPFNKSELLARVNTHYQLKKMQDDLKKQNTELVRLNDKKNEFLGIAAHDLRNPLSIIMSAADLFQFKYERELNEHQNKLLERVLYSSKFMIDLLNDLLDISAIESGKLNLEFMKYNVVDLITSNIEFNTDLATKKDIGIELVNNCNDSIIISIDNNKFEQVLNNLLSNAIKYSKSGTKVIVTIGCDSNNFNLSVKDEGLGIPKEEQDKLFAPFSKTSVKSTGGEKSTGLGLAIVKKIIEGHHGKIWVESEVGVGSTFFVSLPLSITK